MKIFIIGPEGSGKTVLLAMLSRFVATERKGLVMEPVSFTASNNVVSALATLENTEWPQSTRQGMPEVFRWRFGKTGHLLHDLEIADFAGQDIRPILLAASVIKLPPDLDEIRRNINEADILIFLLDLEGLLDSKDPNRLNENAWLFKTFLERPEWRDKHRMVVISKADRYEDLLGMLVDGKKPDLEIKAVIKQHLPQNYSINHVLDSETAVSYLAVSSVETTTSIEANGDPLLRPVTPLKSIGMGNFIDGLIERIDRCIASPRTALVPLPPPPSFSDDPITAGLRFLGENIVALNAAAIGGLIAGFIGGVLGFIIGCSLGWIVAEYVKNEQSLKDIFRNLPGVRHLWIACLALTFLYGIFHSVPCNRCGGQRTLQTQQQVNCSNCGGTGKRFLVIDCGECNGAGKKTITTQNTCDKCNGSGKVYWCKQ